ncbi:hypothetical protein ACT3TB_16465 [Micrococcaceae sp. AOP34-BR2-30]
MTSYTVNVDRDETMWRVRVPEIERTTVARTLGEVDAMARDLIALMTDQDPESFDLAVNVEAPSHAAKILEQARAHRAKADELNTTAAAEIREAARQLRKDGLTVKDISDVLDVSKQRASQLLSQEHEPAMA